MCYLCIELHSNTPVSTKEKLIKRFLAQPKDFTFDELLKLLTALGFVMSNKGKTSGSRVKFTHTEPTSTIRLHKPHTSGEPVKEETLKEICEHLTEKKYIVIEQKNNKEE
jgi:predicted RNA binding protein YcfA (HicA-like mRNA interferase family)